MKLMTDDERLSVAASLEQLNPTDRLGIAYTAVSLVLNKAPANPDPFTARMLKACQAFKDALEQAGQGE